MALNGNGAISTLLRRNNVAEAHRSSLLFDTTEPNKRTRHSSLVMGRSADGTFNKFFSKNDDAWVSLGDTLTFGSNGDDDFRIGLVHRITLVSDSVHIALQLYNESSPQTSRPLSNYCKRRILDTTGNVIFFNVSDENAYFSLFSIQPDFVDGGFFDCPFMDILN